MASWYQREKSFTKLRYDCLYHNQKSEQNISVNIKNMYELQCEFVVDHKSLIESRSSFELHHIVYA